MGLVDFFPTCLFSFFFVSALALYSTAEITVHFLHFFFSTLQLVFFLMLAGDGLVLWRLRLYIIMVGTFFFLFKKNHVHDETGS
jgi:hypothetical protein